MRRFAGTSIAAVGLAVSLAAHATAQETRVLAGQGTATLTPAGDNTLVELLIYHTFGPLLLDNLFFFTPSSPNFFVDDVIARATLVGSAGTVGTLLHDNSGGYYGGEWVGVFNGATRIGSYRQFFLTDPTYPVAGCAVLDPSGNDLVRGPFYGNSDTFGYFTTCGEGAAVKYTFTAHDRISFAENVTSTPEPATLALTVTGFLGIAGFVRRRRRLAPV